MNLSLSDEYLNIMIYYTEDLIRIFIRNYYFNIGYIVTIIIYRNFDVNGIAKIFIR